MPDVIVIGGGFAGLTAAVRLTAAGARVRLLEARSALGGRASAFKDPRSGEWVDNGQHLMLGCYRSTLAFLDFVGARDRVTAARRLEVPAVDAAGQRTTLSCPAWLPAPLHLLAGLYRWRALSMRDRLSALRMAGPWNGKALPDESVEQWLTRNGQTERLREMLWDPLAIAALNQEPCRAAAPYFERVLHEMLSAGAAGSAIVVPAAPLHEMYAEPARRWLEAHGTTVTTGTPARVSLRNGRVDAICTRDGRLSARVVVVAVPWHALPAAFEGDVGPLGGVIAAAAATPASPIVTVNLWADDGALRVPFIGLPGRMVQWVFDKRLILGRHANHLSLVSSAAGSFDGWSNDAIIARAVAEVREAIVEMRNIRVVRANVVRERRATFSCAPGLPSRPGTRTEVSGLLLAGDWIDTGLPGTIEGAVRSGDMAASAAA